MIRTFIPGTARMAGLSMQRTQAMTHKSLEFVYKTLPAQPPISATEQGRVVFVANSTGTVDAQQDNCLPGCWSSVLNAKMPKILIGHKHDSLPIGKVLNLRELFPGNYELPAWHRENNAGALIAEAQFDLQREEGRQAYTAIKNGYADEFSVGFLVAKGGEEHDYSGKNPVRLISKVERLAEISVVAMGASPATQVLAVKSGKTPTLDVDDLMYRLEDEVNKRLAIMDEQKMTASKAAAAREREAMLRKANPREYAIADIWRRVAAR